jgi:DNA-binding beta-propeller fold protein YncE
MPRSLQPLSHLVARLFLSTSAPLALAAILGFSASAAAAPFAYVTHGTDTVSVIDTATMALATTVKFPDASSLIDIAASPDGKRLWLSDGVHFGSILIVDTSNNKVQRAVELPSYPGDFTTPGAIAFAPNGSDVYVADW